MAQEQLSPEAQERINRNIELRRKASKYIKVLDGETRTFKFFAEETESHVSETFDNTLRFVYTVIEEGNDEKQRWEVSKTVSADIDKLLSQGHTKLTVHRIGSDKRTVYVIKPAD